MFIGPGDRAGHPRISAAPIQSGTVFPGAPADRDLFYHTGRDILYFYNAALGQWHSVHISTLDFGVGNVNVPRTNTGSQYAINPWTSVHDIYALDGKFTFYNTANTAGNYFTVQFLKYIGGTSSNLGASQSGLFDTQNAFVSHTITINTLVASTANAFECVMTRTSGGPNIFYGAPLITYRLIG